MSGSGLITDVHLATMAGEGYGEIRDGALAWRDGVIVWAGPRRDLPADCAGLPAFSGGGGWLTPGLIDCHTHLVFAGSRADEWAARLAGESYESIARAGGGILSTVRATRGASEDELLAATLPRLDALLAEGVTALDIKSGYGLDLASERRMLRVARRLGTLRPITVRTSFLAAHAVPPEYAERPDDYLDTIIGEMLPALVDEGLVDVVDAFCERIAFSAAQVDRLFTAAARLGVPVRAHVGQLSEQGGAALVARHRGLSADHLEWLDAEGAQALAEAGSVAVLLPGAFHFLNETQRPPVDLLRAAGVRMAVATDANPGSSPLYSLLTAAHLACQRFTLAPAEALAGITRHAAAALGLADRGQLRAGQRADLALWRIAYPVELVASLGLRSLADCWVAGEQRAVR